MALLTAFCFGFFYLYLIVSITPTESLEKGRHLIAYHDISHQLQRTKHHRLEAESKRAKRLYLISTATKGQARDNLTLAEISLVLTERECRDHDLNCSPYSFCGLTKEEERPVCLCEQRRCFDEPKDFVCGEDGKTYRNPCEMLFRSCMFGTNVTLQKPDRCPKIARYDPDILTFGCGQQSVVFDKTKRDKYTTAGCYQFPAGPVGGSDGRIYESLCALEQTNCINKTKVQPMDPKLFLKPNVPIKPSRPPKRNATKPENVPMSDCEKRGIYCHPYATCKLYKIQEEKGFFSTTREEYECECDRYCISTFRNESVKEPTCGTDLKTYISLCELRRTACYDNLFIEEDKHVPNCLVPQVFYDSKEVLPDRPKMKQISNTTKLSCERLDFISNLLKDDKRSADTICENYASTPICGSDRRVYENLCALDQYNCNYEESIVSIDPKLCLKPNVPVPIPNYYRREGVESISAAIETCRELKMNCPPYASCGRYDIVRGWKKDFHHKNLSIPIYDPLDKRYGCKCKATCDSAKNATCGSDGQIYESPCELRRTSCYDNRFVRIADARSCLKPTVLFDQTTIIESLPSVLDNLNTTFHSCYRLKEAMKRMNMTADGKHWNCFRDSERPICGSDGLIYEDMCALDQENCRLGKKITVVDQKFCLKANAPPRLPKLREENGAAIAHYEYEGCTLGCPFYHSCILTRKNEKPDPNLGAQQRLDKLLGCDCKLNCNLSDKEPVCGSDSKTYPSMCEFRYQFCSPEYFYRSYAPVKAGECFTKVDIKFDPHFVKFIGLFP